VIMMRLLLLYLTDRAQDGVLKLVAATWIKVHSTATSSRVVILPASQATFGSTAGTKPTVDVPRPDGGAVPTLCARACALHLQRHTLSQPPQLTNAWRIMLFFLQKVLAHELLFVLRVIFAAKS